VSTDPVDSDVPNDAGDSSESSEEKFRRWVLPEIDVLYRVAKTITRRQHDAEDLVQDTLIRAYRAIDAFDGRYPRAWLFTILRNTHINRNRKRRPELLRDPDRELGKLADTADGSLSVEESVVDLQFDASVATLFDALPERFRQVLHLVDIEGFRYQETADLLGVPLGTVMSRVHRARTKMRKELVKGGIVVPGTASATAAETSSLQTGEASDGPSHVRREE